VIVVSIAVLLGRTIAVVVIVVSVAVFLGRRIGVDVIIVVVAVAVAVVVASRVVVVHASVVSPRAFEFNPRLLEELDMTIADADEVALLVSNALFVERGVVELVENIDLLLEGRNAIEQIHSVDVQDLGAVGS